MSSRQTSMLTMQIVKLADLIVQAKPARISFQSEKQFLEMLGLQPAVVPVRIDRRKY